MAGQILASLDDINANLDNNVVEADGDNTDLIQISVARVVRGYLSRVLTNTVLTSWDSPENTPAIVREIAGMLIAAQHYFNVISAQSAVLPDDHFAQKLYDRAMALLNSIISGEITIEDVPVSDTSSMNELDFWPVDDTDRAFTLGMEL